MAAELKEKFDLDDDTPDDLDFGHIVAHFNPDYAKDHSLILSKLLKTADMETHTFSGTALLGLERINP